MRKKFYVINSITFYRLFITPFLIFLIFSGQQRTFAFMLAISFFTDLIDGFLARTLKVASIFGSRLDSIADDLTFLTAIIACFVFKLSFITENLFIVGVLLVLYLLQTLSALIKYHKISSFHTYTAKAAAILQGVFLLLLFLLKEPSLLLFYLASAATGLDLIEETILVFMLPEWKANVKGIYWINRGKT
jgi:CDP-diacylglycerol--glycerol-3-phosphate 3-phosphatidyltransferase